MEICQVCPPLVKGDKKDKNFLIEPSRRVLRRRKSLHLECFWAQSNYIHYTLISSYREELLWRYTIKQLAIVHYAGIAGFSPAQNGPLGVSEHNSFVGPVKTMSLCYCTVFLTI